MRDRIRFAGLALAQVGGVQSQHTRPVPEGLIIAFASKRKEIQTKTENENKTEDFDRFRID